MPIVLFVGLAAAAAILIELVLLTGNNITWYASVLVASLVCWWLAGRGRLRSSMNLYLLTLATLGTLYAYQQPGVDFRFANAYLVLLLLLMPFFRPRTILAVSGLAALQLVIFSLWLSAREAPYLHAGIIQNALSYLLSFAIIGFLLGRYSASLRQAAAQAIAEGQAARTANIALEAEVAERRRTEEQLRQKDALLTEVQRVTRLGYYIFDIAEQRLTWSDEIYRLVGREPGSITPSPENLIGLVHPEDQHLLEPMLHQSQANGQAPQTEYRIIRPDGEVRWVYSEGHAFMDEAGKPVRILGTALDITERKQAELARARSEAHYRTLVENLPDLSIFLIDRDQRVTLADGGAVRHIGIDPQQIIGHHLSDFLPPGMVAEYLSFQKTVLGGETHHVPEILYNGDIFTSSYIPLREEGGDISHVMIVAQTITKLRQAEQALREREMLLRQAQHIGRIGHYIRYTDDNTAHWSDETYRLLGLEPQSQPANRALFLSAIHPDDRAAMQDLLEQTVSSQPVPTSEFRVLSPDGHVRWLRSMGIFDTDPVTGRKRIVGTLQDITDRKEDEIALLRSAERLREAERIAHMGNFQFDLIKHKVEWSDELYHIYGWEPGTPLDEARYNRMIPVESNDETTRLMERLVTHHESFTITHDITLEDGARKTLDVTAHPVLDAQGNTIGIFGVAQDVTDKRRAEFELREREMLLQQAQHVGRIGHSIHFTDDNSVIWSDESYRLLGLEPQSQPPSRALLLAHVHPDDRQTLQKTLEAAVPGQPVPPCEFRVVLPDGSLGWRRSMGVFDHDPTSGRPRLIRTLQDITERKVAEIAMEHSARRYRTLVQNLPDTSIILLDRDMRIVLADGAGLAQAGLAREALEGQLLRDIFPSEMLDPYLPVFQAIYRGESREFFDARFGGFYFNVGYVALRDEQDEISHLMVVAQDVTRLRQAERALRERELMLREAQRIGRIGHYSWDAETDEVTWSDEAYRLMGVEPQSQPASRTLFLSSVHPQDRSFMERALAETNPSQGVPTTEYRVLLPNGKVRWQRSMGIYEIDPITGRQRIIGTMQDITERKQVELALERSAERLHEAERIAHMGNFQFDLLSHQVEWSDQLYRIFGLEVGSPITLERYCSLLPDEAFQQVLLLVERLVTTGAPYELAHDIIRADGERRTLEVSAKPICNEHGQPVAVFGVVHDVTEQHRTQEVMKEQELLLRQAQHLGKMGYYAWNLDRGQVTASDDWYRLMGLEVQSVPASLDLLLQHMHPEDRIGFEPLIEETLHEHRVPPSEYRIIRPDGEVRWLHAEGQLLPQTNGSGAIVVGTVQDITERKEAELKLHQRMSHIYFMSTLSASFVNVNQDHFDDFLTTALGTVCTFSQVERGYLFLLNDEGDQVLLAQEWCAPGIIPHRGILDSVAVADFTDFIESLKRGEIAKVQTADIPETPENTSMLSVLRLLSIQSFVNIGLKVDQEFLGWIGFDSCSKPMIWGDQIVDFFDFTGQIIASALERQRSAQALRQLNRELEARVAERTHALSIANRELEAFAYSVSHDLRAPLRSLDGFSQALMEDYADCLDETGQDYLRRIRLNSQRMDQIISDLLTLSRITREQLRRDPVNLSDLVERLARDLNERQPERQAEWQITPNLTTTGDGRLLTLALANLLSNAWKFTSKSEQARIIFGVLEQEGKEVFYLRDNGVGFDMAHADKLFGVFQRLHRASDFEGTGIGLAIVQRVIARHGGRIWAEAAPGQGATFYFELHSNPVGRSDE